MNIKNKINVIKSNIRNFIIYRFHKNEYKLLWMVKDLDKKQFKELLNMEILLIYNKINHELNRQKEWRVFIRDYKNE